MKFTFQCFLQAAGSADDFLPLDDYDKVQRTTAKVMQRTLVFILPLVFISFMLGSLAEYEQVIFTKMDFEVFESVSLENSLFESSLIENKFRMFESKIVG
jgi:hypothetical protein